MMLNIITICFYKICKIFSIFYCMKKIKGKNNFKRAIHEEKHPSYNADHGDIFVTTPCANLTPCYHAFFACRCSRCPSKRRTFFPRMNNRVTSPVISLPSRVKNMTENATLYCDRSLRPIVSHVPTAKLN